MATKDPRVDALIAKSAGFARPILEHLRAVVHAACPRCVESIKWSFPHFDYTDEMLCSMAAFKQYAAFGLWKEKLVMGGNDIARGPMKPELKVPAALAFARRTDASLRAHWTAFPPSHRREYLEWILGARRELTRERRLAQAIAQIADGKSRNRKYERS